VLLFVGKLGDFANGFKQFSIHTARNQLKKWDQRRIGFLPTSAAGTAFSLACITQNVSVKYPPIHLFLYDVTAN
jgi:hypothetical protein